MATPRNRPVRHPLRDALTGGDTPGPVTVMSGVVTGTSKASSPYTVVLRLADGTETEPTPYPAWWEPRTGDVVTALHQGGTLTILGPVAPAELAAEAAPPPPEPPPAPEPPPSRRTVNVQPTDMGSFGAYNQHQREMVQGWVGGRPASAFWFYGNRIAEARAGGRIVSGSIYVQRLGTAHGVGGEANVRLGVHKRTGRPGAPGDIQHVGVTARLRRGQAKNVPLTAVHVAALNEGYRGLGLAVGGAGYTHPDYLLATVGGASGALSLTVEA